MRLSLLLVGLFPVIAYPNIVIPSHEAFIVGEEVHLVVSHEYTQVSGKYWLRSAAKHKNPELVKEGSGKKSVQRPPIRVSFPYYLPRIGHGSNKVKDFWMKISRFPAYLEQEDVADFEELSEFSVYLYDGRKTPLEIDSVWITDPISEGAIDEIIRKCVTVYFEFDIPEEAAKAETPVVVNFRQFNVFDGVMASVAAYTPELINFESSNDHAHRHPEDFKVIFSLGQESSGFELISESTLISRDESVISFFPEDKETILVRFVLFDPFTPDRLIQPD